MFVTVWYGIINLDTGDLEYSNGGHPDPVVITGIHVRKLLRVEGAARVYSRR
jgi:serine phosphatase RsbU (regulator of sigma subunit)